MKYVWIAVLASAMLLHGQGTTGAIQGRVTDPSGALIAGANVTATTTAVATPPAAHCRFFLFMWASQPQLRPWRRHDPDRGVSLSG